MILAQNDFSHVSYEGGSGINVVNGGGLIFKKTWRFTSVCQSPLTVVSSIHSKRETVGEGFQLLLRGEEGHGL